MTFPLDQPVELTFKTYSDAAQTTLADPTAVTLDLLAPDGTESTKHWPTPAEITKTGTGVFTFDTSGLAEGPYAAHWKATGAVATSKNENFTIGPKYDRILVSLEEAKARLGSDVTDADDDELLGMVKTITAIIENEAGPILRRSVTEHTELVNGNLLLRRWPVLSVETVDVTRYGSTTASYVTADLTVSDAGVVRVTNGTPFCGDCTVTYTVGRATVPEEARQACLAGVRLLWTKEKGMGAGGEYPVSLNAADLRDIRTILAPLLLPGGVA